MTTPKLEIKKYGMRFRVSGATPNPVISDINTAIDNAIEQMMNPPPPREPVEQWKQDLAAKLISIALELDPYCID